MEPQFSYMKRFCNDLRSYYNGFVICGGPYPTMDTEEVLSVKGVDAVCIGEGEDALSELTDSLESGKDYRNIRNLWIMLPDGSIIRNRLRPFIDIKTIPPEDKGLFELDKIVPFKNYQLEMTLGRGCVYTCSYCINQSYLNKYNRLSEKPVNLRGYVRIKDIDAAIREMKDTLIYYPQIKKIAFVDDNVFMYDNFLEDFSKKYKEEIGLPFMCNANPMSFITSKAKLLKDAGCDDIRFGVESGSKRIKTEIMKRSATNRKVIETFKAAKALGMMTSSFNMIGLPTETKDEVFETLKLNAVIMPDSVKLMTFYPFKNTPMYDLCKNLYLIDNRKKETLDNYDSATCLKFPHYYQLFLKKVQTAFNWYINLFLNNSASAEYKKLVNMIEAMKADDWEQFDFYAVDREVSERLQKKGSMHYSKFINRSLAVKFPSRHFLG